MRMRSVVVAAVGAVALTLTVPASPATAAVGLFRYQYTDDNGVVHRARLTNPANEECIQIPQAADPETTDTAFSPRNQTTTPATVFLTEDCSGPDYLVLPALVGSGSATTRFRSVVFG
ncbi:hypothetical protein [Streptomyces sp. NPDC048606]|uniref:hypothetical protein n=1 Tax=Streptomyces sp. NPDC048606 TaxID=3154726 RepID=UPI003437C579